MDADVGVVICAIGWRERKDKVIKRPRDLAVMLQPLPGTRKSCGCCSGKSWRSHPQSPWQSHLTLPHSVRLAHSHLPSPNSQRPGTASARSLARIRRCCRVEPVDSCASADKHMLEAIERCLTCCVPSQRSNGGRSNGGRKAPLGRCQAVSAIEQLCTGLMAEQR